MNRDDIIHYLQYVDEVLGVKGFIQERVGNEDKFQNNFRSPEIDLDQNETIDLVFVSSIKDKSQSLFSGEIAELFQKMKSAMKLTYASVTVETHLSSSVEILNILKARLNPRLLVIFKENPDLGETLKQLDGMFYLETFSPGYLIRYPEQKKLVWNDLQKIMKL